MKRKAEISRKTKETKVDVSINIDGKGKFKIDTGIGFLDHMLEQLSKHSLIDLKNPPQFPCQLDAKASGIRFSGRKGRRATLPSP